MKGNAKEFSGTLEWMLQSRQVGDESLVKILVQEQYSQLHCFVDSLMSSKHADTSGQITEKIIRRVVEDSTRYNDDIPVRVWLFRRAFSVVRGMGGSLGSVRGSNDDQLTRRSGRDIINKIEDWFAGLNWKMCSTVSLFYLFDFDTYQIASILELSQDEVAAHLQEAKARFLAASYEPGKGVNSDKDIRLLLKACWPELELEQKIEEQISARIINQLHVKNQRRKRICCFAEIFLAFSLLVTAIGMNRIISGIPPEPAAEIITETRMIHKVIYVLPTPAPISSPTISLSETISSQTVRGGTQGALEDSKYSQAQSEEEFFNYPTDQTHKLSQREMIWIIESRMNYPTSIPSGLTMEPVMENPEPLRTESDRGDTTHYGANSYEFE